MNKPPRPLSSFGLNPELQKSNLSRKKAKLTISHGLTSAGDTHFKTYKRFSTPTMERKIPSFMTDTESSKM